MTINAAQKGLFSIEVTKNEIKAKHVKTLSQLRDLLFDDECPGYGKTFLKSEYPDFFVSKADGSMNDTAEAYDFYHNGVHYLHVSLTMVELFEVDEDGEFIEGSDFDCIPDFDEKSLEVLKSFGIEA